MKLEWDDAHESSIQEAGVKGLREVERFERVPTIFSRACSKGPPLGFFEKACYLAITLLSQPPILFVTSEVNATWFFSTASRIGS